MTSGNTGWDLELLHKPFVTEYLPIPPQCILSTPTHFVQNTEQALSTSTVEKSDFSPALDSFLPEGLGLFLSASSHVYPSPHKQALK